MHVSGRESLFLLLGISVGIVGCALFLPRASSDEGAISRAGGYEFINPLLSCDISEDTPSEDLVPIQKDLNKKIEALLESKKASRISVYFRDMDNGRWSGVRVDDRFAPASLMKVSLLIAYLQSLSQIEQLQSMRYTLSLPSDRNIVESIKPISALPMGQSYTLEELLKAMVQESDNNASQALNDHVNQDVLRDVYEKFGVHPADDESADVISPRDYMRFFRILYNGSYLSKSRSRTALEMLAGTNFQEGIVAGLPARTTVAHKFGERTITTVNSSGEPILDRRELHDCGIVYYPKNPYGICVMTEGIDFADLESAIAEVSRTLYEDVNKGMLQ